MSQLNSSTATHISPKILCQYLPILVWSGAYAPGRRCRRKTSEKTPFFGIATHLCTHSPISDETGAVHISTISEINFRNACWGTSPNPSKMPQGHFVKTLWKTGRLSQKFWMWKKSSSGDFLLMFFRIKVEQKHAEKFRFVKNLASCFQICYSKCRKEQPLTKWLTSWSGNKPTRIRQETR